MLLCFVELPSSSSKFTPRMLPARTLRLLLLRLRLPLLLTDERFFKVPLREGVTVLWPWVDERDWDRTGSSPSPMTEDPRVRASKFSSNLPANLSPSCRCSDCESGDESYGFAAKSLAATSKCEEAP